MRRYSHRSHHMAPEPLNITSFMNLMVILVPFLLITAVFSRMAILELNIPLADAAQDNQQKPAGLQLEVTIRSTGLEVADRNAGLIKRIVNSDQGYDFKTLSNTLKIIKAQSPETLDAVILAEPDISYDAIIQLMDTMRVAQIVRGTTVIQAELFPNVSIGDAPAVSLKGKTR